MESLITKKASLNCENKIIDLTGFQNLLGLYLWGKSADLPIIILLQTKYYPVM